MANDASNDYRGGQPPFRRSALFPGRAVAVKRAKVQTRLLLPGESAAVDVPFRNKAAAEKMGLVFGEFEQRAGEFIHRVFFDATTGVAARQRCQMQVNHFMHHGKLHVVQHVVVRQGVIVSWKAPRL